MRRLATRTALVLAVLTTSGGCKHCVRGPEPPDSGVPTAPSGRTSWGSIPGGGGSSYSGSGPDGVMGGSLRGELFYDTLPDRCDMEPIFLHFAESAPEEGFRNDLENALGGWAVYSILPERKGACYGPGPCARDDGHRRFFLIDTKGTAACQAVSLVRAKAHILSGLAPTSIKVGVDRCYLRPLDAQRRFGQAYVTPLPPPGRRQRAWPSVWHRRDIGALTPLAEVAVGRVALVDTPIPDIACSYGSFVFQRVNQQAQLRAHSLAHGTAMASLVRSVMPRVPITSHAAITATNRLERAAGPALVARGLDDALFGAPQPTLRSSLGCPRATGRLAQACGQIPTEARAPLFVNLSFGMPAEADLSRPVPGGCPATEDGPGRIFEYLLGLAREMDSPRTPVLVTAAAGNFDTGRGRFGVDDTAPGAFFVPAQLEDDNGPLALVVGEVGPMQGRGAYTRWDREPRLVAPGERVYPDPEYPIDEHTIPLASGPRVHPDNPCVWPVRPEQLDCSGAHLEGRRYLVPSAYSGTSVSTALVTGAAVAADAKFWAVLREALRRAPDDADPTDPTGLIGHRATTDGITAMSGKWLARVLYAAGAPTGRMSGAAPVRELCLAKLDGLFANYTKVRECIESPSPALLPDDLATCLGRAFPRFADARCPGAMTFDDWKALAPIEDAYYPPGGSAACAKGSGATLPPPVDVTRAPLSTIRADNTGTATSATGLGPQPGETSCTWCGLVIKRGDPSSKALLLLHFNPELPPDYSMSHPALLVQQDDQQDDKLFETDLTAALDAADSSWTKAFGASVELKDLELSGDIDPTKPLKAVFVVTLTDSSGESIDDYAPLMVDYQ